MVEWTGGGLGGGRWGDGGLGGGGVDWWRVGCVVGGGVVEGWVVE